jgi:hypothetical protein
MTCTAANNFVHERNFRCINTDKYCLRLKRIKYKICIYLSVFCYFFLIDFLIIELEVRTPITLKPGIIHDSEQFHPPPPIFIIYLLKINFHCVFLSFFQMTICQKFSPPTYSFCILCSSPVLHFTKRPIEQQQGFISCGINQPERDTNHLVSI